MATGSPLGHENHVYTKDEDLPFANEGHYSRIGEGQVDKVRRVGHPPDNALYARKSVMIEERNRRAIMQEAMIMERAHHSHVVRLVMTYFYEQEEHTTFSIIMDRADSNLDQYILGRSSKKKTLHLFPWFGCLIGVVAHIHGLGIRHRDIKPTNILIKNDRVLLADFGISKMGLGKTMPTTIPALPRARTRAYCAPEVENGSTRGRSADIFSLGAVFLEMLLRLSCPMERAELEKALCSHGTRSYAKAADLVHQFMDNSQEMNSENWSRKVLSHCRKMLRVERDQRPLAEDLNLAWLSMLPSDEPLGPCRCPGVAPVTGNELMVELCKKGSLEEVQMMLANGADANTIGAIHQASARGFTGIVEAFLEYNVDVNLEDYSKQTALHCAAGYGYGDIVGILLGKKAGVRLKDNEGQTALHCAAGQGHSNIVDMLIENGADVQDIDNEGRTALQFAASRGHETVVNVLLKESANTEVEDSKGHTALHFAAGYGSEKVVGRLLELLGGNTINVQDEFGRTALHFAARGKQVGGKYTEVRRLLENMEADLTLKDSAGRTASWYTN